MGEYGRVWEATKGGMRGYWERVWEESVREGGMGGMGRAWSGMRRAIGEHAGGMHGAPVEHSPGEHQERT